MYSDVTLTIDADVLANAGQALLQAVIGVSHDATIAFVDEACGRPADDVMKQLDANVEAR